MYRDGRSWVAAVTVPGSGGRRLKRRARTERQARRLLAELLQQAGRGVLSPPAPARLTLGAWAREWVAERRLGLRASAAATLEGVLAPLWRPDGEVPPAWRALGHLGRVRVDRVTSAAVSATVHALLQAGAGARRVQMLAGYLRRLMAEAERRGLLGHNPLADLPRPRVPERERPEWSLEQIRRFVQVATDPEVAERLEAAPFLAFLLLSGLRVSEGLAVTWADLNLPGVPDPTAPFAPDGEGEGEGGESGGGGGESGGGGGDGPGGTRGPGVAWVWVRRALVWTGTTAWRLERPKTRAGERAVALPGAAVAVLRRRWAALPVDRRRPEDRIWTRPDGQPYRPSVLSRSMDKLCRQAQVPPANVHFLRHVHAAMLVTEGVDLVTLRRHLGHQHAQLSLDRYSYPLRAGAAVAGALEQALTSHDARQR